MPAKHPMGTAWSEWLESDEGKRCAKGTASGRYLENRLWAAFMAGWLLATKRSKPKAKAAEGK